MTPLFRSLLRKIPGKSQMYIRVNVVQECDATTADSSTGAGIKNIHQQKRRKEFCNSSLPPFTLLNS